MQCCTPKRIEDYQKEPPHNAYAQEEEIIHQETEVFFMVAKDVDSVMTCGAAFAQMPKDETNFANTVPSSQSHCSHFQTKRGHFLQSLSQTDCHD